MKEKILNLFRSRQTEGGSNFKPFTLFVLGPSFLMMGLSLFLGKASIGLFFLSSIAVIGFILSWIYQFKGMFYSAGLLVFSLLFLAFLEIKEFNLFYSFIACLSFITSFYLVAVSSMQGKDYEEGVKKEHDDKCSALETTFATNQSFFEKQLDLSQEENKALQKNLKAQEKEMISFRQLMVACQEESEQYCAQADLYKKQAHEAEQIVLGFQHQETQVEDLKNENRELLKKLNDSRVQSYEYEILAHQELREKKEYEKPDQGSFELSDEFIQLVEQRKAYKKMYDERLREYKGLSEKMEIVFSSMIKDSTHQDLVYAFEDLGRDLQEIRLDILKVEEGILHLKKEWNISEQEGLTPGSYLAVADQECLRLEEENTLLLKLLSQLMSKNGQDQDAAITLD